MKKLVRQTIKTTRKSIFTWRYGFNLSASLKYKFDFSQHLNERELGILEELNRYGIAKTTVSALFGEISKFAALEQAASELVTKEKKQIEQLKSRAENVSESGEKSFNVELLGSKPMFEPLSIFATFALQETFLNIANAYFGMLVKFRYYNLWYTFATDAAARESQLWHFDREDNYILKVFLYLKDVGEGAGPFTYAPETHRKGKLWGKQPEFTLENNIRRSKDEQMRAVVPEKNWIKAIGDKGTIIFADTRGYHKGGEARTDDRLMYTFMFTSPASDSARLLTYPATLSPNHLTKKQLCALEKT